MINLYPLTNMAKGGERMSRQMFFTIALGASLAWLASRMVGRLNRTRTMMNPGRWSMVRQLRSLFMGKTCPQVRMK
jgi:hypothetical protein